MRRIGSTPADRGSSSGATCPDVIELDNGDYYVIGRIKRISQHDKDRIALTGAKIGWGECAVIVPRDCLRDAAKEIAGEAVSD